MITKQEILQLLADTECHSVERTTSKNDRDKFCQAICAFTCCGSATLGISSGPLRFKGLDRSGDIIHEFKFEGNLCKSLPKIDTFIETSVSTKRPIPVSVLWEEIASTYPYWATRELLMNAIMHRDYDFEFAYSVL